MSKINRLFSLSLALLFFMSVTGINVYKHYCGDFLAAISIYVESDPCCGEKEGMESCGMDKKMACCDNEVEFHQLDITLHKSNSETIEFKKVVLTANLLEDRRFNEVQTIVYEIPPRDPPELALAPLYLMHGQFTFYG